MTRADVARVSVSIDAIAASEPRSPSKLPPLGTESMCEPNRIGGSAGVVPARRAKMLPAAIDPRLEAGRAHQAHDIRPAGESASEYATRLTPSANGRPRAGRTR